VKREELRLKTFGDVVWRWDIESQEADKVVWNDTPWRVTAPFVSVERESRYLSTSRVVWDCSSKRVV